MAVKNKKCEEKLVRSRVQLLMKFPFYGTLALNLQLEEDESIPTAGTDGSKFYYNPEFIMSLSEGEINWIMAHEVMHAALGHIWRRGHRIHEKFNISADYAIHCILKESEGANFTMPKQCLYDPKFNNMSTEEIYDTLPDMPQMNMSSSSGKGNGDEDQNGQQNGNYPQTFDDHSKWDTAEAKNKGDEKAREWQDKMISAAEVAEGKKQGSVPGGISRLVNKLKKPQKNWRQLLAEFVQFEIFDYGFLPPDKRYYGFSDVLMPDFNEETEKVQDIVFIIDTSGSIQDEELTTFYSELVGMMHQFHNSVRGHIIFVDSKVAAEYEFEDVDDILKAKPAGGGGTDMEEGIRHCIEKSQSQEWDVCGCCILTDGYTDYTMQEEDIPFKTLWIVTNENQTPTYGQVTRLKL